MTDPLGRWGEIGARFGLDEAAIAAGGILLEAELDGAVRTRLLGDLAGKVAPRRSDVIAALAPRVAPVAAAAAVMALESRGLAVTFKHYAGPWALAELSIEPRVRQLCVQAEPAAPAVRPRRRRLHARLEGELKEVIRRCRRRADRYLIVVRGRAGSGRDTVLAELARALRVPTLARSVSELRQGADPLEPELSGGAAVWDARRWEPSPDDYDGARRWLHRSRTVAVALLDRHQDAPDVEGRAMLTLDLDPRTHAERRAIWEAALREAPSSRARAEVAGQAAALLGDRNGAGAGLAARASALAAGDAATADDLVGEIESALDALVQPSMLRGILVEHPEVALGRVVAAPPVIDGLERLVVLCGSHARVEAPGRRGVKALLAGPPGTGKTMAARALAHALRRPLYRVDLASVMSRWVGETEKNLREAMIAGEVTGAVLLFDEGDSLFARRGEVEKGSDRYANMEVSYLLQAIEAYAGIAVVTTNQRGILDAAFDRRFDVFIDFSPPTRHERRLIWTQELGASAAGLPPDYLGLLARRAELNGGSIAAAARLARVLAFKRGADTVSLEDLRVAIQGEFLKTGLPVQAAQWTSALDTKSPPPPPAPPQPAAGSS